MNAKPKKTIVIFSPDPDHFPNVLHEVIPEFSDNDINQYARELMQGEDSFVAYGAKVSVVNQDKTLTLPVPFEKFFPVHNFCN